MEKQKKRVCKQRKLFTDPFVVKNKAKTRCSSRAYFLNLRHSAEQNAEIVFVNLVKL